MEQVYDVAIIGGGINGCGCAADAALRGLSVVLIEKDDLSSHTSSNSTKLIHGGLRYLEQYEFGLVKKALTEREVLLKVAPHIVHPLPFILPYQKHLRPAWLLKIGLFIYDHLSNKNTLPKSKSIQKTTYPQYFDPIKAELPKGFLYYDASVEDSRLAIINALQAKKHGASIRPRATVVGTETINDQWQLTIEPHSGVQYKIHAKTLINASGPWVESVAQMTKIPPSQAMALVKGSHIIVPKMYLGLHAYILQHSDKRVVFVIPYHGYTMIGTTEVVFNRVTDEVKISLEETNYLINTVNSYFKIQLTQSDVKHTWSGIRPLLATEGVEAKALSRDYRFQLNTDPVPIITIYGGKITTYRQLSKDIIDQLAAYFPQAGPCITEKIPLPGASYGAMNFNQFTVYAKNKYHWLDAKLLDRYLYCYGSLMECFMSSCTDLKSMGLRFGASLYQVEIDYLLDNEWAAEIEDILIRRTQLILEMNPKSRKQLNDYLVARLSKQTLVNRKHQVT